MTTLHPGFRRLILRHLPKLSRENLNRYEGLIAMRWQLIQQLSLARDVLVIEQKGQTPPDGPDISSRQSEPLGERATPQKGKAPGREYGELPGHEGQTQAATPREKLEAMIDQTTLEANAILAPFRKEFDALHELWTARRRLALQYGGLLQIPATGEGMVRWITSFVKYYDVQLKTFPTLFRNRLKNFSVRQWLGIAILVALTAFGASTLYNLKPLPQPDNGNTPPDSTAIRPRG